MSEDINMKEILFKQYWRTIDIVENLHNHNWNRFKIYFTVISSISVFTGLISVLIKNNFENGFPAWLEIIIVIFLSIFGIGINFAWYLSICKTKTNNDFWHGRIRALEMKISELDNTFYQMWIEGKQEKDNKNGIEYWSQHFIAKIIPISYIAYWVAIVSFIGFILYSS
jgi:hypothetical protein